MTPITASLLEVWIDDTAAGVVPFRSDPPSRIAAGLTATKASGDTFVEWIDRNHDAQITVTSIHKEI